MGKRSDYTGKLMRECAATGGKPLPVTMKECLGIELPLEKLTPLAIELLHNCVHGKPKYQVEHLRKGRKAEDATS
mgnify:CR=1 FL=1